MLITSKALAIAFLFFMVSYLNSSIVKPELIIKKQDTALNFPSQLYEIASMGNRRLMSSFIWVQTLLESDIQHYKQKDLNSWMFLRFQHITELEPKFIAGYLYGGQYLSIIKDDDLGAEIIYDKGIKQYPNHYELNFNAAFHYYFELSKPKKALQSFKRIQHHAKAPSYLPSLVARISLSNGASLYDTYALLQESYKRLANDAPMKKYYYNNLYAIKAQLDLACLNNNNANCQKSDLDGSAYQKNAQGQFQAIRSWTPFKEIRN